MGTHVGLRRGVELSKMQYEMRRCPLLGEHTEYVCKNIIGMSDEEFIRYMAEKVFE
jgi:benzylsuccinate CoA-transferase BbsF subunit